MSFKAGNHLRFAEALVAISIYANAFAADAQIAPDIASTSGSAAPSLNLRMPAMPGRTPPLASPAPSVGPFEEEVRSLETAGSSFRNGRLIVLRKFVHSPLEDSEPSFYRVPGTLL